MAERYTSVAEWEHAKQIDVDLPSGVRVRYEIPDLPAYVARGNVPNPLADIAFRLDRGVIREDDLEPDDARAYFDLQCWIIGTHLREPNLVTECGGPDRAAEWVATRMHPDDRATLWARSVHIFDAEQALTSLMELVPFRGGESGARDVGAVPSGGKDAE